jgi:hypothetical protein
VECGLLRFVGRMVEILSLVCLILSKSLVIRCISLWIMVLIIIEFSFVSPDPRYPASSYVLFMKDVKSFISVSIFFFNCFLQIEKAEFSCPSWFPVGAKSLIHRILDPNPETVSIGSVTRHCFIYTICAFS